LIVLANKVDYTKLEAEGSQLLMARNVPWKPFFDFRCSEHKITKKSKCRLIEGDVVFVEVRRFLSFFVVFVDFFSSI
jgi:hypothetical protein